MRASVARILEICLKRNGSRSCNEREKGEVVKISGRYGANTKHLRWGKQSEIEQEIGTYLSFIIVKCHGARFPPSQDKR